MARAVAILGDSLALPDAEGESFTGYVQDVLGQYGVDFLNWSKPDQVAAMLATEGVEDLQAMVKQVASTGKELFVIVEVGTYDRVDFTDMLAESLGMILRVIIAEDARALVMQVVPDDIDRIVASEQGAGFISAPASVVAEFDRNPSHPFKPSPHLWRDMAESVLKTLEEEMHLPLTSPATDGDDEGTRPRTHTRGRATHDDDLLLAAASQPLSGGSPFDGVWIHKDKPQMFDMIQGNQIVSADGHRTQMVNIDHSGFCNEHEGQLLKATLRGDELHWDDGDIWCLKEDTPLMDLPPTRRGGSKTKPTADSKALLAVWQRAEQAVARSAEEAQKSSAAESRGSQSIEQERREIEEARRNLEEGLRKLHEETERVSALREGR